MKDPRRGSIEHSIHVHLRPFPIRIRLQDRGWQ